MEFDRSLTHEQAIDLLAHRDSGKRFSLVPHLRHLCREDNPDILQRDGYRRQVILMAGGSLPEPVVAPVVATPPPEPPAPRTLPVAVRQGSPQAAQPVQHYPAARTQAKNLFRSVKGWVKSGCRLAPKAIRQIRQATCNACPFWNGSRCSKCGCRQVKLWLATESCPDQPPRWTAV